ncbi:metal-dependent hydrolase [Phaeobacter sp. BS23]|uniref:metal-dependent hydrolase n=2 Tax=unclassified Phaeobacter TaxID=2621772 RepID=UPI00386AB8DA
MPPGSFFYGVVVLMLTAHLPSGYVLARLVPEGHGLLLPAALIGAVLPDFDMLWFHFVDHGSIHHHRYWVHIPAFWAMIAVPVLVGLACFARSLLAPAGIFFAALFLHMVLDTIGGGILWGAPFSDHLYTLVHVPATQSHWVLSFLLHWTFILELGIWALALYLWRKRSRI